MNDIKKMRILTAILVTVTIVYVGYRLWSFQRPVEPSTSPTVLPSKERVLLPAPEQTDYCTIHSCKG